GSFFVAKRDGNRGNQRCRDVSLLSCLQKLNKNILRVDVAAHARVGDSKTATRQMRRLLGFGIKGDCFRKIPLLALRGGQDRIQIKVIWIELERSLAFDNCIVNAVVSQVGGGGYVAGDRRHGIQFLSLEDQLK